MDQVSEIREKIDIVSFIGEFLTLKKAGRNFKANCPFHNEKTPSFVVSPERQIWHCFGCNRGGDCYSFLMQYEHVEFPEALRMLAKRTGVVLQSARFDSPITSKKESIYKLNALAAEFYHYLLTKHRSGQRAQAYLKERGLTEKLIGTFKIGYAPNTGFALTDYLIKKKGYTKQDMLDAGLGTVRGRGVGDFFLGRIMFPLTDHRENIVGFSGRSFTEGAFGPKYINTRETLAYHKGEMFYGLVTAKEAMKRENQVILVEGEFDVIACFREGITNVVAIKGTALTEPQVKLLSRFVQKVTMCLDGDNAGYEAMKRSLAVLEPKGLTTTVIVIPQGKDPDEALKTDPGAFKAAVKDDIPVYDYLMERMLKEYDIGTVEGKKTVGDTLLSLFSRIENEIVKEHYMKKLSRLLDTTYESLLREMERLTRRDRVRTVPKVLPKVKRTREELLEEYLLALIVQSETPSLVLERAVTFLADSVSRDRAYQKILYALQKYLDENHSFDGKRFGESLPKELHEAYNRSCLFPLAQLTDQEKYLLEAEKVAMQLHDMYLRQKMRQLALEIAESEKQGHAADELRESYSHLASSLKK